MNDLKDQPRPRKILGMNSKLGQPDLCNSENFEKIIQKPVCGPSMDRMRFSNMNNNQAFPQEIPPIWPYGTFLSPLMATPNIPLPYAIAPNMQYTTVPIFSQAMGNGTAAANNGNAQHQQNMNSREPSKMTIQIGVQCVNQNNPININTMNDMGASIAKMNLQVDPTDIGMKDNAAFQSPPLQSRRQSKDQSDSKTISSIMGTGEPSDVVISARTFEMLKALALSGSETAEKLAYTHRNRPCFKKIDSLCARLKQDLIRPDGVLPNINSQGIAWAVKDFIFVFTRVMNAWIIIKGYVYNTPEGLNKVRSAFSPEFVQSFSAWQETTVNFVDNLIQSFINLDNLVQSQKNVYQKVVNLTPIKITNEDYFEQSNSSMDEPVALLKESKTPSNNYMYTMVENSDLTQRDNTLNGTYFKTGTYNFIKRESSDEFGATGIEQLFEENFAKTLSSISSAYDLLPVFKAQNEKKLKCNIKVLENKLSKFSNDFDPNLEKPLGKDLINKLNVLMEKLMQMENCDVFFKFPDFIAQTPDFIDIRNIILKCQTGLYGHIFEVVHDVRLIVHYTKEYLKKNINLELSKAISLFQHEVEMIFSHEPFENYNFDHIKGIPNEILYYSGK